MNHLRRWPSLLIPLVVLLLILLLRFQFPGTVESLQLLVFDTYQRLKPRPYTAVPVKIIDVDDETLRRVGHWPWPRTRIAQMVERLESANPAVVAFDVLFAEPDRTSPENVLPTWPKTAALDNVMAQLNELPHHDDLLASALRDRKVVTGFVLTHLANRDRPARKWDVKIEGPSPHTHLRTFSGAIVNLPPIEAASSGNGSFNFAPERDSVIRRLHLVYGLDGEVYPSFAAEALRVAQGEQTYVLRTIGPGGATGAGAAGALSTIKIGSLPVPTDSEGRIWLHYTDYEPSRFIPAWQIFEADFDPSQLAGHILLVGTSAAGLKDLRATPLNSVASGVEVHAAVIEQVLLGQYLFRPGWAEAGEILLLAALGMALVLLLPLLRAFGCAALGAGVVVAIVAGSWYAYTQMSLLLDPLTPSIAALFIYLAGSLTNFIQTEAERRQVRDAFGHYLAPAVIEQLLGEPDRLRLSGERRQITFLFTDIAGFTSLTEGLEPENLVRLLNDYLDETCNIVLHHGGTIDKIVGDALHVMFNAPSDQPDHAERAVKCALDLDEFCESFKRDQNASGIDLRETRIGVNTGPSVVGNFGGTARFDYTAHGDAINTAARLESVNRYLGTRICVSESTRELCPGILFRPIAQLVLKGKNESLRVYEPCPAGKANGMAPLEDYAAAYSLIGENDAAAAGVLDELAHKYPQDGLVTFHANRLMAGDRGTLIVMGDK